MNITLFKKFKNKFKKQKGFTLMEIVVAIAIFSIISVLMTNIVISMARFSLLNERRNDFMTELDSLSNVIKNDLRSAKSLGVCGTSIYMETSTSPSQFMKLERAQTNDNTGVLRWIAVNDATCSNPNDSDTRILTSSTNVNFVEYKIAFSNAEGTLPAPTNTLLYIYMTTCDPSNFTTKVFDCNENPYAHIIALSTRKIS